ncbi:MAG: hypothetical protein CL678_10550 [Bdellovibrionaceae bacterium]|nr:hypothetical protein [Pseudobdellovibrionaceae bacterium]
MKILILLTTLSFGIIAQATNEDDPTKKDDRTCQYRFAKRKGTAGTPQPIPRAQRQRIDLEKSRPIPPVRPENKKMPISLLAIEEKIEQVIHLLLFFTFNLLENSQLKSMSRI